MTGVVKGIETAKGDLNTVTAVNVRLPDNTEITIPATLVAGMNHIFTCAFPFLLTQLFIFIRLLW